MADWILTPRSHTCIIQQAALDFAMAPLDGVAGPEECAKREPNSIRATASYKTRFGGGNMVYRSVVLMIIALSSVLMLGRVVPESFSTLLQICLFWYLKQSRRTLKRLLEWMFVWQKRKRILTFHFLLHCYVRCIAAIWQVPERTKYLKHFCMILTFERIGEEAWPHDSSSYT